MTKNVTNTSYPVISISEGGSNADSYLSITNGVLRYDGTEIMPSSDNSIDSDNFYSNTAQPSFSAYRSSSVNNITGDGTIVDIVFNVKNFDTSSNYSTSTGEFTAPIAGTYSFTSSIFSTPSGVTNGIILYFNVNGTAVISQETRFQNANITRNIVKTAEIYLSSGDKVKVQFQVYGSGSKVANIFGYSHDQQWTYFCGHLLF